MRWQTKSCVDTGFRDCGKSRDQDTFTETFQRMTKITTGENHY